MSNLTRMFSSKAKTAFHCENEFNLRYNHQLVPSSPNFSMVRGSYVHKILEVAKASQISGLSNDKALGMGLLEAGRDKTIPPLPEEDLTLATEMAMYGWEEIKNLNIVDPEKVYDFRYPEQDYLWRIKTDALEETKNGFWLGEYKTTKAYGPALQRVYHRGIQPWVYIYMLEKMELEKPILGVKMFVMVKTPKNIKDWEKRNKREFVGCFVEEIPNARNRLRMAEEYIKDSVARVKRLENTTHYEKNRNNCDSTMGECPYRFLCEPDMSQDYFNSAVETMFHIVDPEEHLNV